MAPKKRDVTFAVIKKIGAGVALLSFLVIVLSALRLETSWDNTVKTILFRSVIVMIAIKMFFRMVIEVLKTYEEADRGQAE